MNQPKKTKKTHTQQQQQQQQQRARSRTSALVCIWSAHGMLSPQSQSPLTHVLGLTLTTGGASPCTGRYPETCPACVMGRVPACPGLGGVDHSLENQQSPDVADVLHHVKMLRLAASAAARHPSHVAVSGPAVMVRYLRHAHTVTPRQRVGNASVRPLRATFGEQECASRRR